jgi:7,8-dihydropterin-6-yl-methyl-4-(beta-D-ribofuranosyl)aminobenzene 5'-phosphate synthase
MTANDSPIRPGQLSLKVLVNNTGEHDELQTEPGFSALLETEGGRLLFDTGASAETVLANAKVLGVDLANVKAVALSHGHWDHTGGLAGVLEAAPGASVYMHPQTVVARWSSRLKIKRQVGMSDANRAALEGREVIHVEKPMTTPQGLILSGTIPGPASPAQRGFEVDLDGERVPDPFVDELFVLARTASGVVLVSGCCHRGLVNTLKHAQTMIGEEAVRTVIGGLHMARLSETEMDAAITALKSAGTESLIAGHCTGEKAIEYLAKHASFRVETFHVGFSRLW